MLSPRTVPNGGERGQEHARKAKKKIEDPPQDQPKWWRSSADNLFGSCLYLYPCLYGHPCPCLNSCLSFPLGETASLPFCGATVKKRSILSQKCRVAAPKIWAHQGVIKSESGHICTTSSTLDSALRATRSFWQDFPSPYHSHWTELLSFYASRVSPVPHCSPPNFDDFYKAITSSPDSAPGADGLPFAAWRVAPAVSANALASHFNDIQTQQARTPLQSLVFIPKADKGDYADNYRPLGLPNTCDRLIDRAAYSRFATTLIGALHPAQALLNTFREPQANFLTVQHFLNNTQEHGCVLLSDLAKAFERVNPHWIMHVLFHLHVPYWVII